MESGSSCKLASWTTKWIASSMFSERPCFSQIQWRIEEDTGSQPLDPKHPNVQMHTHTCEHTSTDTYTYIIHMKKIKERRGHVIGSLVTSTISFSVIFSLTEINFSSRLLLFISFLFHYFLTAPLRCYCLHSRHSILPMLSGFPTMSFWTYFMV